MRPRINPACINPKAQVFSQEVYTIKGNDKIVFYHRGIAIARTQEVAIKKQTVIVIMLNGYRFAKVDQNGKVNYIYNPAIDNVTDNKLKSFFISRGFVMAHYGKVA